MISIFIQTLVIKIIILTVVILFMKEKTLVNHSSFRVLLFFRRNINHVSIFSSPIANDTIFCLR